MISTVLTGKVRAMLKDPLIKIILFLVLAGCGIIIWGIVERGMRKGAEYDKERAQDAQERAEADVAVSVANGEVLADHADRVDASTSAYVSDMATISTAVDTANIAISKISDDTDYDQRRAIVCSVCYDAWTAICGPYMPTTAP